MLEAPDPARVAGATATTGMIHIAVQEKLDKAVDWLEQVTDEQYQA